MGFLSWIILGAIAGAIAKKFMPGVAPKGLLVSIGIGIAGGLLGGAITTLLLGIPMGSFFDIRSWVIAILGAAGLLWIYQAFILPKLGTQDPPTRQTGDHTLY